MLVVEHLTGPAGAPVLHDVALAIPYGATQVVLGPMHSGKTMLLRHILGLEEAEAGEIVVDGARFDARQATAEERRWLRSRVGVVFEVPALVSRITAVENVELPLLEHAGLSSREAREAARELLFEAGAAVDELAMPDELGRQEQRRVALARALALRPPLLLLDEPTSGLDAQAAHELDDTLARLQQSLGFARLVLSHDARFAFGRVDRIYVMDGGTIVAQGELDALRTVAHPTVQQLLNRRGRG